MTNETKAPERIWAEFGYDMKRGSFWDVLFDQSVEYIRHDHALALVAVAYEKVIDLCENAAPAPEWGSDTKSTYRFAGKDLARSIRKAIPADAQAALEARDKRVREMALREALEICLEADRLDDAERQILGLIEKDKTDE